MFGYTQKEYWGGPWYPYWSFLVLTMVGGFFGLDHLWLRSPLSGLLKFICNIFFLGLWWFYDIIQAWRDKQSIMENGLHAPFVGGLGIGKGMFRDLEPDAKPSKAPWRYLGYLFFVCFPFGFDLLIAGDLNGAFARFLTTIIPILWPIGFIWGLYNMGKAFFTPDKLFRTGISRFFPFTFIMKAEGPNKLGPKDIGFDKTCDPGGSHGFFRGIYEAILAILTPFLQSALNIILPGIQPAVQATTGVVESGATAVKTAIDTSTSVIEAAKNPAVATVGTAATLVQTVPQAVAAVPEIASQVGEKLEVLQKGGGIGLEESVLFPLLLITLTTLLVGGATFAFFRMKKQVDQSQNEPRDDTPPKPSVL